MEKQRARLAGIFFFAETTKIPFQYSRPLRRTYYICLRCAMCDGLSWILCLILWRIGYGRIEYLGTQFGGGIRNGRAPFFSSLFFFFQFPFALAHVNSICHTARHGPRISTPASRPWIRNTHRKPDEPRDMIWVMVGLGEQGEWVNDRDELRSRGGLYIYIYIIFFTPSSIGVSCRWRFGVPLHTYIHTYIRT